MNRISFREALLLCWQTRSLPWYRPREGWVRWLIWGREVYELQDPVMEGWINDGRHAPEWMETVPIRRGFAR